MVTVKLYVEGAAKDDDLMRQQCRQAFGTFFGAAGIPRRPRTVACGGRDEAYKAFVRAVNSGKSNELPLLLVDAEDLVADGDTCWQHLRRRDNWVQPSGANDDQAFLMVQVMETWFLADSEVLHRYFGEGFSSSPFRKWPALEEVPKHTVYDTLKKATANCRQAYQKGEVSFEILKELDPKRVENACPHAQRLLERLRNL